LLIGLFYMYASGWAIINAAILLYLSFNIACLKRFEEVNSEIDPCLELAGDACTCLSASAGHSGWTQMRSEVPSSGIFIL
jgi:hypothetical protein